MKHKLVQAYMQTARTFAELSHARRLHVGAIVVKDDRIISIGYNGMPAGWDNDCEEIVELREDGHHELKIRARESGQHISAVDALLESQNGQLNVVDYLAKVQ